MRKLKRNFVVVLDLHHLKKRKMIVYYYYYYYYYLCVFLRTMHMIPGTQGNAHIRSWCLKILNNAGTKMIIVISMRARNIKLLPWVSPRQLPTDRKHPIHPIQSNAVIKDIVPVTGYPMTGRTHPIQFTSMLTTSSRTLCSTWERLAPELTNATVQSFPVLANTG